ncbi:MAG: hypothetical protein Q9227_004247 [Pyrenula ochraceoflavens]
MLDKEEGAATKSIAAFDQSFRGFSSSRKDIDPVHALRDFIAHAISADEERDHKRRLSADFSDSGIGSSIASDEKDHKITDAQCGLNCLEPGRQQGLTIATSLHSSVIDPSCSGSASIGSHNRLRSVQNSDSSKPASAVTRSICPSTKTNPSPKALSNLARRKINDNIFQPILRENRFKFFHPLVKSLGSRSRASVNCLRDLEKSLIFEPLVSDILGVDIRISAYKISLKKLSVPRSLYRTFGEFSIQLVLDTYSHLSEPEQRRAADRPYDNGYFLDLVQQVGRLAAQVSASRSTRATNVDANADEMTYSPYVSKAPSLKLRSHNYREDEVTLEGGLGHTGNLVELVRWKDGKGISLRTNEPYEPTPGIKRRMSEECDDDIERSMARRKKNADPTPLQLHCSEKSCDKIFERKCDLAKHEKTHSRPFKCPHKGCQYYDRGLPTEKERERHMNDKHTKNPKMFTCDYCTFKTKRESNCKQHMEKKHGFVYERSKGKGKKMNSMTTPQQTPQTPCLSTPLSSAIDISGTDTSASGSAFPTPFEAPMDFGTSAFTDPVLFPPLRNNGEDDPTLTGMFDEGFGDSNMNHGPFSLSTDMADNGGSIYNFGQSPAFTNAASPLCDTSALRLNTQNTRPEFGSSGHQYVHSGSYSAQTLPTPESCTLNHLQPFSRNPSISHISPIAGQTFGHDGPQVLGVVPNLTPSSDFLPAQPSFSPTGQDQALNEFVPSDSQFDAMWQTANIDNITGNAPIPDFDLYGDGTGADSNCDILMGYEEMDMDQGPHQQML